MYTGIVQACVEVQCLESKPGMVRFAAGIPNHLLKGLQIGASVSLDGVCLTVIQIEKKLVWFEAMAETLRATTFGQLQLGQRLNIERSALAGVEIGGHVVSGHINGMARVIQRHEPENNLVLTFQVDNDLMKYIFSKGFIGLHGASLTVVNADHKKNTFQIWFIPETLRVTNFGTKQIGDYVNLEVEFQTKVLVDTVERLLPGFIQSRS